MNRPCSGALLLVGEGDFSLSVAVRRQLPHVSMVTSSLLSEEEIRKLHRQATSNIQNLQVSGATVLLNTDAKKLHTDRRICNTKFQRIVFNFPHVGGKSNIKKNRELLKNFFLSGVEVLADEGDIQVTLCNGQGGTPADQPQRSWHNCWQVVSMATYANLILTETALFHAEDYPEYSSSGFRSQDKHFNTEGAVVHIFIKAKSIPEFGADPELVTIGDNSYWCPAYVSRRVNRLLHNRDGHPLCLTRKLIEDKIKAFFPVTVLESSTPILPYCIPANKSHNQQVTNCYSSRKYRIRLYGENQGREASENVDHESRNIKPCGCDIMTKLDSSYLNREQENSPNSGKTVLLRSSLLDQVLEVIARIPEQSVCITSGTVFERTSISLNTPSVYTELLALFPFYVTGNVDLKECVLSVLNSISGGRIEAIENGDISQSDLSFTDHVSFVTEIDCENHKVGFLGKTNLSHQTGETSYSVLCLDLDILVVKSFGFPDSRILWSKMYEYNFRPDFCVSKSENSCPQKDANILSTRLSLYPPCWEHHISFWTSQSFDEQRFIDIIRAMADDVVESVTLKESYVCPETGRTGYCYVERFRSCDQALSYHRSHDMQTRIRLKVAQDLNIQLR